MSDQFNDDDDNDPLVEAAIAQGRVPPEVDRSLLYDRSRDEPAVVVISLLFALTAAVALCRVYARLAVLRRFGLDDVLAVVSLILLALFTTLCYPLIRLGSGRHAVYIQYVLPGHLVRRTEVLDYAAHLAYTTALFVCRLSGLAFYHRLLKGAHPTTHAAAATAATTATTTTTTGGSISGPGPGPATATRGPTIGDGGEEEEEDGVRAVGGRGAGGPAAREPSSTSPSSPSSSSSSSSSSYHALLLTVRLLAVAVLPAAYAAQMLLLVLHCLPVTALWPYAWEQQQQQQQPEVRGYGYYACLPWGLVYGVNSGTSLVCDFLVFGVPVAMLRMLGRNRGGMGRRRRVQLAGILLPGIGVIAISLARIALVVAGQYGADQSWIYNPTLCIEVAEVGGTLIALSVPGLVPLVDKVLTSMLLLRKRRRHHHHSRDEAAGSGDGLRRAYSEYYDGDEGGEEEAAAEEERTTERGGGGGGGGRRRRDDDVSVDRAVSLTTRATAGVVHSGGVEGGGGGGTRDDSCTGTEGQGSHHYRDGGIMVRSDFGVVREGGEEEDRRP